MKKPSRNEFPEMKSSFLGLDLFFRIDFLYKSELWGPSLAWFSAESTEFNFQNWIQWHWHMPFAFHSTFKKIGPKLVENGNFWPNCAKIDYNGNFFSFIVENLNFPIDLVTENDRSESFSFYHFRYPVLETIYVYTKIWRLGYWLGNPFCILPNSDTLAQ